MALHEQPSSELKRQVAEGSLSPKKEARAEAVLRHRRTARISELLGRYSIIRAFLALFGLNIPAPRPPQD
jgi:hypothetical protein